MLALMAVVGALLPQSAAAARLPAPPAPKKCATGIDSYRCVPPSARVAQLRKVTDRHKQHGLKKLAQQCRKTHCARLRFRTHQGLRAAKVTGAGSDGLSGGQTLTTYQYLVAANGQYKLVMQDDGNLVLYTGNISRALWASGTNGHPGSRAVMQSDGNLVVYDAANHPLWASNTAGQAGASLALQTDGNLVVYSANNTPLWASGTVNGMAGVGDVLTTYQYLTTGNGQYKLVMQDDGNLVLYTSNLSRALWATWTNGHPGARAVMQGDGNFVVYDPSNQPLFNTHTNGIPGSRLFAQSDGNVAVYNPAGGAVWQSNSVNTHGLPGDVLYGGSFITSPNGQYRLIMQGDGNLVMYDTANHSRWASNTAGHPGAWLYVQSDGNVVVYTSGNAPLFATWTQNHPGSRLEMQSDGNLVVYQGSSALWDSHTAGTPVGTIVNDYPSNLQNAAQDSVVDPWGFYNRECTSWVAYRINQRVAPFTNTMSGGRWGNASNWAANAQRLGYSVNQTPTVGSIAQWNAGEQGAGSGGHVAYVARVNSNGTVLIEQYNGDFTGHYSTRDGVVAPRYIHIG